MGAIWDLISEWLFRNKWIRRGLLLLILAGTAVNFRSMSGEAWLATGIFFAFFAFHEIADLYGWGKRGKG